MEEVKISINLPTIGGKKVKLPFKLSTKLIYVNNNANVISPPNKLNIKSGPTSNTN